MSSKQIIITFQEQKGLVQPSDLGGPYESSVIVDIVDHSLELHALMGGVITLG